MDGPRQELHISTWQLTPSKPTHPPTHLSTHAQGPRRLQRETHIPLGLRNATLETTFETRKPPAGRGTFAGLATPAGAESPFASPDPVSIERTLSYLGGEATRRKQRSGHLIAIGDSRARAAAVEGCIFSSGSRCFIVSPSNDATRSSARISGKS